LNILAGGLPVKEAWNQADRREAVAGIVARLAPDVAVICEDNSPQDLLSRLRAVDGSWRRLASGPRGSGVYSRWPGRDAGQGRALVSLYGQDVLVKAEHWYPKVYGPNRAQELIRDGGLSAGRILEECSMPEQYQATYLSLLDALRAGTPVILAGDFNEPSDLDWTERYERIGSDRWVANGSGRPLRPAIRWAGSRLLRQPDGFGPGPQPGLIDAYRAVHPDEAARPGNTWTPPYPNGTPGRRPYDQAAAPGEQAPLNQVLDRIDRVYVRGLEPTAAFVVGESGPETDLAFDPWPSDHRGVLVHLRIGRSRGSGRA
jgi:hypothetical protein